MATEPYSQGEPLEAFGTDRLVVRRLTFGDLNDFAALCGDPDVVRFMDDGRPLSRDRTREWIEVSLANYRERGWGCFAVAAKPRDRMIGFAGFARPPERPGVVELVFAFGADHWGRGYATEIAGAMAAFGLKRCGLNRIEATVYPANEASRRVLEKIGMVYEGRMADDEGTLIDHYAIERVGPTAATRARGSGRSADAP